MKVMTNKLEQNIKACNLTIRKPKAININTKKIKE